MTKSPKKLDGAELVKGLFMALQALDALLVEKGILDESELSDRIREGSERGTPTEQLIGDIVAKVLNGERILQG